MTEGISIYKDRFFFHYNDEHGKFMKYYLKNLTRFDDFRYVLYKKKYWRYNYYADSDIENHQGGVFKASDIKFNKPISYLVLLDYEKRIQEIKSLPKTLKVIWFQGLTQFGWKFPVTSIPKGIVTIYFRWCWNPLQGKDLSSLKKLQVFYADGTHSSMVPKFPRSIVAVSMENNPTLFYLGVNFNISDYPKLKYVNFRGSIDPKKVPKEWKNAKKSGKIEILW